MLKNIGGSRQKLESYGYYKPTGQLKDGKEVLEWHSRIVEGRYKVLLGVFLNAISVRQSTGEVLTPYQKVLNFIGLDALEAYSLKKTGDPDHDARVEYMREVILDGVITLGMYLTITGTFMALGGGDYDKDKKDPFNLFAQRVINNFGQQWNIMEPWRDLTTNLGAASLKVSWYRAQSMYDITAAAFWLSVGEEDRALTRQGTLRGSNRFIKYWLPYGGAYYDFVRLILGESNVDEFTYEIKK